MDEPSAYLDSEQRIAASKVIKRFIMHAKKTAFVVEHDFIMATYLADRVIVYDGEPGVETTAHTPQVHILFSSDHSLFLYFVRKVILYIYITTYLLTDTNPLPWHYSILGTDPWYEHLP